MELTIINKSEIRKNYNVDRILTANDLKVLASTYKDNLETIPVMMKKKKPTNSVMSQILEELVKINSRLSKVEQRLSKVEQNQRNDHNLLMNVIKLNHLRTE